MRTGVEKGFLPIVGGFDEGGGPGRKIEAQATEGIAPILFRREPDAAVRIVDLIAAADRDATALRDGRELAVIIAQHLPTRAEIEAAKAVGDAPGRRVDDPAGCGIVAIAGAAHDELRQAVGRRVIGVGNDIRHAEIPVPIDFEDTVLMRNLPTQEQMPASIREGHAGRGVDLIGEAVALVGYAGIAAELQALITLVEHEIDHARDRVGTIGGRCASRNHLDAADELLGEGVDVDKALHGRRHGPPPVEQDQRPFQPEIAQIDRVDARQAGADVEAGIRQLRAACDRGELADEVEEIVGRRFRLDLFRADDCQRSRAVETESRDARAGDDDLIGGALDRLGRLDGGIFVLVRNRLRCRGHCRDR